MRRAWRVALSGFRCRRCGNCCARPGGVVFVTREDVRRISSHLGLAEAGFRRRYLAAAGDRLVDGLSHGCVFLRDGRASACAIHPVRPERCRSWPDWPELDQEEIRAEAIRFCAGLQEVLGSPG